MHVFDLHAPHLYRPNSLNSTDMRSGAPHGAVDGSAQGSGWMMGLAMQHFSKGTPSCFCLAMSGGGEEERASCRALGGTINKRKGTTHFFHRATPAKDAWECQSPLASLGVTSRPVRPDRHAIRPRCQGIPRCWTRLHSRPSPPGLPYQAPNHMPLDHVHHPTHVLSAHAPCPATPKFQ